MRAQIFTLPALFAMALAACQQPASNSDIAIDNEVNAAEAANADIEVLPPSDGGGAPVAEDEASTAALPTTIPASLHGRWGLNRADCTSTRGDAKGLLTIDGSRLVFYESRGTVDKALAAAADSYDARYSFTGEGQTWSRTERLKLVGDKLQRRTDAEPGQEPPVNLTYERCGA